jgi:ABC-type Zn uptake system ZnuABC Zn-binding protein ZnuA
LHRARTVFSAGRRAWLRSVALALAAAAAPGRGFAQQKLRVVATSPDLKSLIEAVGRERVDVESLVAPGEDPHALEVKPAQLAQLRAAALVVRVGLDHEPWFARLKLPKGVPVLDASRSAKLLQTQTPRLRAERRAHVHAWGNTHYWLDPANAIAMTADIREALAALSPADVKTFDANRSAFVLVLGRKEREWQALLAPYRGTRLVVMHDSWAYFAEAFGLDIVAAAEPSPGVPPSPAELAELVGRMREAGIRILVADPGSNPSLVRTIGERTGAQAVTLHPSGHDYVRLLDENVATLTAALKASAR